MFAQQSSVTLPYRRMIRLTKNRPRNTLLALDMWGVTMKVGRGNPRCGG
jgi:hypothetical protein